MWEGISMAIHESAEDYLESILVLQNKNASVHSIDIVNDLGYSRPSVSIAMKKLRESGHIEMAPDGEITLTESGYEIASSVYERHTTLKKLFMSIGIPEAIADEDACKVEHDLSETTFRMIRKHMREEHGLK